MSRDRAGEERLVSDSPARRESVALWGEARSKGSHVTGQGRKAREGPNYIFTQNSQKMTQEPHPLLMKQLSSAYS